MAGQGRLAEEVRTRLEVVEGMKSITTPPSHLDAFFHRKTVRTHVREFGALFATILVGYGAYIGYRYETPLTEIFAFTLVGLLLRVVSITHPNLLVPAWRGWMMLARMLSVVMTPVMLTVLWVGLVIPLATLLKLFKTKIMDTTFREPVESYWISRDPKKDDFKLLERQF